MEEKAKKVKNVDFDYVITKVVFSPERNDILISKEFFKNSEVINAESHSFSLTTMPLSVALQLACGIVQQCGLVEYE